ncbi:hypothetical protein ANANG_G00169840 [Anguilla anguilla]|uniref:C2H2-type domain-containing protein n=1 Tax=Anguilla anguilla TaxID=7936 RepID=A0A9D3M385_ANGAN|nr:hypothetical protein ANANG_G00169840 [Anguilla anguilla]
MTNFLDIHAELASIMDILAKSAVAEISRLVDDGAALLRLEISRSHREIAVLKRNLQLKESELQTARRLQERFSQERERSPIAEKVLSQEWSFRLRRGEQTCVQEVDMPLQSSIMRNQHANMEKVRPEPVLIKEERLEDNSDPQPTPGGEEQVVQPTPAAVEHDNEPTPVEHGKKQEKEPIPVGDPEELSEQHRCEHGDMEFSGLEFVVKAEQEEEHVAQRLSPSGDERKAPQEGGTGEKRFSCVQCGKSFTTRFYLKIHRRIHTGERPFNCAQCGKSFYCTSHLTSHQRSHTGEKPYSCDECGNSYSHLNSLKLHYRVHADERELGSA